MRSNYGGKPNELYTALCGIVAVALFAVVVIGTSLRLADKLRPKTGDMISFDPARSAVDVTHVQISATTVGKSSAASCILEPRVMQELGGSFVIESTQFEPELRYRVHWAGARTSDDGVDCGSSAELVLSPADIGVLSLAAAG